MGRCEKPWPWSCALLAMAFAALAWAADAKDPSLVGERSAWSEERGALSVKRRAQEAGVALRSSLHARRKSLAGKGYVEVAPDPKLNLTSAMTLEAWIRPAQSPATGMRIIDKTRVATAEAYTRARRPKSVGRGAKSVEREAWSAGGGSRSTLFAQRSTQEPLPVGQWAHVAATFDGDDGKQRLFVNGKLVAEAEAFGQASVNALPLRFGADSQGGNRFHGDIDSVRIYCRALEPEEILAHAEGREIPPMKTRQRKPSEPPDVYSLTWSRPSKDSSGSMPLGNGDIGLNLWVEEDGDLFFYIGKTDAWSENARLLKLGRVRVKLTPNPFTKGAPFRQTLRLKQGEIEIQAGKDEAAVALRIWVDANQPVIRVETESKQDFSVQAGLEVWRDKERKLEGKELFSAYGQSSSPNPVIVLADTVLPARDNRIAWFHRNGTSIWQETLKHQGMESWIEKGADPLLNRTFGGVIKGDGLVSENATALESAAATKRCVLSVYPLTKQAATPEAWVHEVEKSIVRIEAVDAEKARAAHREWWESFWNRSWIRVSGAPDAAVVTRGYTLQRFISACAGRGNSAIKFNGSIFTVDAREGAERYDADYRRWGGPYWFQNTRLAYWPMLASGDFEMMRPLFRMFLDALPFAKARTRVYFGHDGAFFPETMYFWGAYANDNYGWNRKGKPASHVDNTYIRHYWSGSLELTAMMLDCFAVTQDEQLVQAALLPLADAVVCFYDKHYPRDEKGRLLIKPSQALETWQTASNPLPPIAGLRWVLAGLSALPAKLTSDEQRKVWQRLRSELPPLPMQEVDGKKVLLPAEWTNGQSSNSENPELYAVFPYRLYGVSKPDLEIGRATFARRKHPGNNGWRQDDIQAAYLGLAAEARRLLSGRFTAHHGGSRFPAFWGPNYDWIPDQDHGTVGLMALQTMLLQADGGRILLFPAWPKEWDVEFKLHAPMNTTVEGVYKAGKLERLKVTPEARAKDVVRMDPQ